MDIFAKDPGVKYVESSAHNTFNDEPVHALAPIPSQFDILRGRVENLKLAVNFLIDRVSPALSPEFSTPANPKGDSDKPVSTVTRELVFIIQELEDLTDVVNTTTSRVEL